MVVTQMAADRSNTKRVPLPPDWFPSREHVNQMVELSGIDRTQLRKHFIEFRVYWIHGKGAGTERTMHNWAQSWTNWVKNVGRFNDPHGKGPSKYASRIQVT